MKHLFCKRSFSFLFFFVIKTKHLFCLFSNHLRGQDILHIDIYDKDLIFDDKIGSLQIDLHELYTKSILFVNLVLVSFSLKFMLLVHIDDWFNLLSRFGKSSHGELHLILDYQPLQL